MAMRRSGMASLRLHPGRAPHWLVKRMIPMAGSLCEFVVNEYSTQELLNRLADPVWFQALSNVLGYDWDSSGSTTVTCGVLRSILTLERHGVTAAGGKGLISRKTPDQLRALEDYGLDGAALAETSKVVAKVDNAAIQDGYHLYHHVFFVDDKEKWTVVQQGIDYEKGDARRYHWTSEEVDSFIEEPHTGIISGEINPATLNLTSKESEECRKTTVDIVKEEPTRLKRMYENLRPYGQSSLEEWVDGTGHTEELPYYKVLPQRMNWNAVRKAYEMQPVKFEDVLFLDGIGPGTIRALSLISEMIYGSAPSWSDPVRMTFALGGKDGVPFPVPREEYDEAIQFMKTALDEAKIGKKDKVYGLKRLGKFAPPILVGDGSAS